MKYILSLLFLVLFITIKKCSAQSHTGLRIKLNVIKEYYSPSNQRLYYVPASNDSIREKRFNIQATLINNSDSVMSFWIMTCSWDDNFLINNTYIFFRGEECASNFPHVLDIKPNDSVLLKTTLIRAIIKDNPCQNCIGSITRVPTTKIGLIYIDTNQCKGMLHYWDIIEDRSTWKEIIWSAPLYLNK
jgi:hypothetical protein